MEPTGTGSPKPFEQWALIELFGHQRIAGLVSEQAVGGCTFLRVDVPPVNGVSSAFTKLYGQGAIYAMTFTTEAVARAAVEAFRVRPVSEYEVPALMRLRDASSARDEHEDYEDDMR